MKFEIDGDKAVELSTPQIILVGYSGRNSEQVRAHVAELAEHGVPAPTEIPAVWHVPTELLSQASWIEAPRVGTSGEVEPVLLFRSGEVFVTVGSDHTDRELERTSMDRAKRALPKIVAKQCWPLSSIRPAWDHLELSSEVKCNGKWRPYQRALLEQLLPPEWFVDRFGAQGEKVIFCGTVPAIDGVVTSAESFRASLKNLASGQELSCWYRIGTHP